MPHTTTTKNLQEQRQWIKQYHPHLLDSSQSLPKMASLEYIIHDMPLELERRYGFFSCVAVGRDHSDMHWQELRASTILSSCFSAASWVIKRYTLKPIGTSSPIHSTDEILRLITFNDFVDYFSSRSYEQIVRGLIHITHHKYNDILKQRTIGHYNEETEAYITSLCKGYERLDDFLTEVKVRLILHLATDLVDQFLMDKSLKTRSFCFFSCFVSKKLYTLADFIKYCDNLKFEYDEESTLLLMA